MMNKENDAKLQDRVQKFGAHLALINECSHKINLIIIVLKERKYEYTSAT
jgi:hypothetical protein